MAKEKRRINFSGVDSEIRDHTQKTAKVPEGDYIVKIVEAEYVDTENGGYRWRTTIVKPEQFKGKTVRGYTSLKREALWNLRNLINAALGKNVAGKKIDFDPEKLYGKVVGAEIVDNEYERDGETRVTSQINTWFPKDEAQLADDEEAEDDDEFEDEEEEEEEEEDEEEEEEKPRRKKKKVEEDDDDDEELEEVEVESL